MHKNQRLIIGSSLVLVILIGGGLYYRFTHKPYTAVTTSKAKTAQPDYQDGGKRLNSQSEGNSQGGAIDTKGADIPTDVVGISSKSGQLTVKQPANDESLSSGSVISGTVKDVKVVQYRLLDNTLGVIAQGSLSVIKGSFSGSLQFQNKDTSGRLDVFTYNSGGEEENNIEIPVRYKE